MRRPAIAISALLILGALVPNPTAGARPRVNINQVFNSSPKHLQFFRSTSPELLFYGGAGAGKSYTVADKLFLQGILNPGERQKIVVVRKTLASLRKSTLDIIERRAETLHRPFLLDRSKWTAKCGNQTWVFTGMNNREDYQKIKSLTDVNFIWANELTELREDDYRELGLRLRGARSKHPLGFRQMVGDFNPIGKTSWIYERFWQRLPRAAEKIRVTALDNPWAEPEYIAKLKASAADDPNFYNIYFLGEWGELQGVIFNWDDVDAPPANPDSVFFGGDFGYSVDPAAVVKIYRKAREYWLEEILYRTGLTNQDMARALKSDPRFNPQAPSYWDSAEPKSIEELFREGINAQPATKGPDSVRAGIDYMASVKIHVISGSPNIAKEAKSYVRKKDKNGYNLPEPIEFNDHAMSAARYGIYSDALAVEPRIRSL